jgi:hypothetical protein
MLLVIAAITSVVSTLAFVGYLLLPTLAGGQPRTHFTALYAVGISGLIVAEVCQLLGVVTLLAQWASRINVEKKPKELAVLLVSLIPYMVVIIFLITLVVYLRARRHDRASERTREAAQELKEQVVDTLIDAGANTTNTAAGSPTAAPSGRAPHLAPARSTLHDAVRQVVGPATGQSISRLPSGLLAFTAAALLLSTAATAGVVVPSVVASRGNVTHGIPSATASATPGFLTGGWTFTETKYLCTGAACPSAAPPGPYVGHATFQQSGSRLTLLLTGSDLAIALCGSGPAPGTISGAHFTVGCAYAQLPSGQTVTTRLTGTVVSSTLMRGTISATDVTGGSTVLLTADWTATRAAR